MRFTPVVWVPVLSLTFAAVAIPALAQTITPPSGPLESLCDKRYQVVAGAGTAPYDPVRSRLAAHPLSWDQLQRIRYARTIRSDKDLPSGVSPTRRLGGF